MSTKEPRVPLYILILCLFGLLAFWKTTAHSQKIKELEQRVEVLHKMVYSK
jgi:hypothetical protein